MPPRPVWINRPVYVAFRIAHRVRRIVRQCQPVMIAGHKFETLAGRLEKLCRGTGPRKNLQIIDLGRPQLPRRISHRQLPAIEITRQVNCRLIRFKAELLTIRQDKHNILSAHEVPK